MKITQAEWSQIRERFLAGLGRRGVHLSLRERVWGATGSGEWVALPGTSDSPDPDKWWLGCDPEKLRERRALGVILLCQSRGGPLYTISLPQAVLHDLESKLVKNHRQVFFNVARRRDRFILQLRGGEELDVTGRLDDFSWIEGGRGTYKPSDAANSFAAEAPEESVTPVGFDELERTENSVPQRFFAIMRNKALHPLDDVALETGALYLVEARQAASVPGNTSLRRIVARGGPDGLPADFAERHDYYAHGARRR